MITALHIFQGIFQGKKFENGDYLLNNIVRTFQNFAVSTVCCSAVKLGFVLDVTGSYYSSFYCLTVRSLAAYLYCFLSVIVLFLEMVNDDDGVKL